MNTKVLFVILIISSTVFQGCSMTKISGHSSTPLLMNNPNVQTEVVGSLNETKLIAFDYTSSINVYTIISDVVNSSDADAVTNLSITLKSDPSTFFINLVTIGIANAYKVQVTGDLVMLPSGIADEYVIDTEKLYTMTPEKDKQITTVDLEGFLNLD